MLQSTLKVVWFDQWNRELDQAIATLPPIESFPTELYTGLIQSITPEKKKIALMLEKSAPVAIIGLKQRLHFWVPVNHYLIPGTTFPHVQGFLAKALYALKINMHFSWWRIKEPPPKFINIKEYEKIPTYGINLSDDFEEYWRSTKHLNDVKRMRNRCKDFFLKVNSIGHLEWVFYNWEKKWRINPEIEHLDSIDRLFVIKYLEKEKQHFTLSLCDNEKIIAAHTFIEHNNDLVWQYTYRDEEYNNYSPGIHLLDLAFQWGAKNGFNEIDLGGDYPNHKKRWAPANAFKYNLNIYPKHIKIFQSAKSYYRRINNLFMQGET